LAVSRVARVVVACWLVAEAAALWVAAPRGDERQAAELGRTASWWAALARREAAAGAALPWAAWPEAAQQGWACRTAIATTSRT
jgi:hypothetical protein